MGLPLFPHLLEKGVYALSEGTGFSQVICRGYYRLIALGADRINVRKIMLDGLLEHIGQVFILLAVNHYLTVLDLHLRYGRGKAFLLENRAQSTNSPIGRVGGPVIHFIEVPMVLI
jgi:hypothetical protein